MSRALSVDEVVVPNARTTARQLTNRVVRSFLIVVAFLPILVAVGPPASASARGAVLVRRATPVPVLTGVAINYDLFYSCGAVLDPTCVNSKIDIDVPPYIELTTASHPYIQSTSRTASGYTIQLSSSIPAGSSSRFKLTLHAVNGTTPTSTFSVVAKLTFDNGPNATSTATGAVTASTNIAISKTIEGNAIINQAVRYGLRTCNTSGQDARYGQLNLATGRFVDVLPNGAEYVASSGGIFDGNQTVTWTGLTNIGANNCSALVAPEAWVDVRFPSGTFVDTQTVTNHAEIIGYPYTQPTNQITATTDLNHGFLSGTPTGDLTKFMTTNPYSFCDFCPYTGKYYQDGRTEAYWVLNMRNTSTVPAEFDAVDMMPCVERPNAWRYYHSLPGEGCPTPMFITETLRIDPMIVPGANFGAPTSTPSAKLAVENAYRAGWRPTYLSSTGRTGIFETIDDVTFAPVGLLAGERIAEVTLPRDSRLELPALSNLTVGLGGYVPADVPADAYMGGSKESSYNGYRYRMFSGSTEAVNTSYEFLNYMRPQRPNIDLGAFTRQYDTSYEMVIHNWSGEYLPLMQAVLLAPGIDVAGPVVPYTTEGTAQPGNIPAGDAFTSEIIQNFAGTGRTLVRMMTKPGFTVAPHSQIKTVFLTTTRQALYPNRNSTDTHWAMVPGRDVQTCSYTPDLPADNYIRRYSFIGHLSTTDPLDVDGDGRTSQASCQWDRADNYYPPADPTVASLRTVSYVKGDLDPTEVASPNVATISDGGHADFRVDVQNLGTALTNAVVYDVLPSVNDTGTLNTAPRGSVFRPTLAGPLAISDPSATVEYSTSANPCRPDIGVTTSCVDDWTTTPATWSAVRAYRVTYPTLAKVSTTAIRFTLNAPVGIAAGDTAWNNVVVTALEGTTQLLPAESPKVGMARPLTDISLAISLSEPNGLAGQARTVTVAIKHDTTVTTSPSGLLTYSSPAISTARGVRAAVTLPASVQIVPGSSSAATFNESTRIWDVGDVFVDSQQTMTFQVTAATVASFIITAEVTADAVTDVDSTPNDCGTTTGQDDCVRTTLTTSLPQIALQTQVESSSGSGIFVEANSTGGPVGQYTSGQPIHYRFVVSNTGVFALSNIVLTQTELAGLCDLTITGTLDIGASRTIDCVWSPGRAIGTNITTASVSGSINGVTATAADDAKVTITAPVVVPVPGLTVDATVTNLGASPVVSNDNIVVRPDDPLAWKYVITNSGSDSLLGFLLTDQSGNHPDLASCVRSDGGSIDDPFLPGVQATCTYPFSAVDGGEARTISANLVASSTLTAIDASDSTAYLAGTPGLAVSLKVLDPRTGLYIEADDSDHKNATFSYGDAVHWQLTVTNTGPISISDVEPGLAYGSNCDRTMRALDAGASFVVRCDSVAYGALEEYGYASSSSLGLYTNNVARIRLNASVAMQVLVADGPTSTTYVDSTPVYAVGHYTPGDTVKWRVVVTNDGEIELTGLSVNSNEFPACNQIIASLAVGASQAIDCTSIEWTPRYGSASVSANEHVSASDYAVIAMSAPDPADSLVVHMDVLDRSGTWQSGGDYNFRTNSYDAKPTFLGSDSVRWRVRVDNPSAVDITNVKILYTGLAACDQMVTTIVAGGHVEFECTSDTTEASRYARLYAHGHYLTYDVANIDVMRPALTVDAQVRSPLTMANSVTVETSSSLSWVVVVTNSGDNDLSAVTLVDDLAAPIDLNTCSRSDFSDPTGVLHPGVSVTCTMPFLAVEGGATRTFTASGTSTLLTAVSGIDPASYVAGTVSATASLLVKDPATDRYVEADSSDNARPLFVNGETTSWRTVITNTGTYAISDLQPNWSGISCTAPGQTLAIGEVATIDCTSTTTAALDASVSWIRGAAVIFSDAARVGVLNPALTVSLKVAPRSASTAFIEADNSDGLTGVFTTGDTVPWRLTVKNIGDTDLANVTVTTPGLSICDSTVAALAVNQTVTIDCTSTASASVTLTATASAQIRSQSAATSSNAASVNVLGVPSATIDLLVLDPATGKFVDADDRDHLVPNVLTGRPIYWRVIVVNTGTTALTGVTIGDTQTACGPIDADGIAVGATLTQDCTTTALHTRRAEYRSTNSGIIERSITLHATGLAAASDIARVFIAQPASIGDQVWYDTDGSDTMNGDEHGQLGIAVHLYLGGIEIAQATTDADGRYHFDNLLPGEYVVTFTIPSGNFVTTGPARAASLGLALAGTIATVHVTVSSGDIRPDISIGVRGQNVDVPVNTPATTTPATAPTPPPSPTVPPRAGLPKTGTDARNLLEVAGLASLLGIGFVVLARRRKTTTVR